eukprot:11689913-Heterocapsa_arctica.AAC.1
MATSGHVTPLAVDVVGDDLSSSPRSSLQRCYAARSSLPIGLAGLTTCLPDEARVVNKVQEADLKVLVEYASLQ